MANDRFGYSVSLSSDGNNVAVGAPLNDANGGNAGHVRVYTWNGTDWIQKGVDIDGEVYGDWSGCSVSLSSDGNTVAIGAFFNDENGNYAGHVRVYNWNGTDWIQKGLDIDGESIGSQSGSSVSISSDGNTLAIGGPYNSGNGNSSGHVRIYNWAGTDWIQKGMDIDGEEMADHSGCSVSLSPEGNTVAIGAVFNDGNGSKSGQVRIYSWNGAAWIQKGLDIDGEAIDDQSGYSVSISDDGHTVAIGAPYNDGNGDKSGQVRVYHYNSESYDPPVICIPIIIIWILIPVILILSIFSIIYIFRFRKHK
jgi:hypothetical protein